MMQDGENVKMDQANTAPPRGPSAFGRWLRETRKSLGMSQSKLAERSNVHRIQIAFIETGRTQLPQAETQSRLFAALGAQPPADLELRPTRWLSCAFCNTSASACRHIFRSSRRTVGICGECLGNLTAELAARERRARLQRLAGEPTPLATRGRVLRLPQAEQRRQET